jgi:hypothetical protein
MRSRNFYLVLAAAALLVALWLTLQMVGAVLKLAFLIAIVAVAVAVARSWRASAE